MPWRRLKLFTLRYSACNRRKQQRTRQSERDKCDTSSNMCEQKPQKKKEEEEEEEEEEQQQQQQEQQQEEQEQEQDQHQHQHQQQKTNDSNTTYLTTMLLQE